jgi:undecaprenyl-diphosphatase
VSDLLQVILLGIIEGITEFLPISSTGHLLIAETFGLGTRTELFNVVIQAGAILAVTVLYRQRLRELASGFSSGGANRDYLLKFAASCGITIVLGFVVTKLGFKLEPDIKPIAWALLIGGVWIIAAEWFAAKQADSAEVTWTVAIVVGLAQIVAAVFPGTSRSGATIFAAMLVGMTNRAAATEFAFLVGIPTMYAASGYELLKALKKTGASGENWTDVGIAFVVATVVAFIAVKWLLGYIKSHRFTVFAIYRVILGGALLVLA